MVHGDWSLSLSLSLFLYPVSPHIFHHLYPSCLSLFSPPSSPSSRLPDDRDIILSTTTVTLTPDQLETSVNVTGFDDNLYEGAESAQLAITSLDIAVLFSSPSPTIDVEIVDNDCE